MDIPQQPFLTREEELIAASMLQNPETRKEAIDRLVLSNLGFAVRRALKWRAPGMSHEDMIQEAFAGLVDAASRYNGKVKFRTYAYWYIKKHCFAAISRSAAVAIPREYVTSATYRNAMTEKNLADAERGFQLPLSLESDCGRNHSVLIARADMEVFEKAHNRDVRRTLLILLRQIPVRERRCLRRWKIKGHTLQDIAKDMGISYQRAHQLARKAMERIQKLKGEG